MNVLAMVNQKGGVGKTTVSLGLAAVAASQGSRVLIVDLDPQANATSGVGVWNVGESIESALLADEPGSLAKVAVSSAWADSLQTPPMIAPSSPRVAPVESQLATDPIGAQERLAVALDSESIRSDYDLVIIDCPPSLGLLTVNGLFAADRAVIVTEPSSWAVDGVAQILKNIERISQRRSGALALAGVVVNRLGRTRDGRYWDSELVAAYGDRVIRPAISLRAVIAEASAHSEPITAMSRSGSAEALAEFTSVLHAVVPDLTGGPRGDL